LRSWLPIAAAAVTLALLQLALGHYAFFAYLASLVGVNVILAVSLNIVNGMTGQFSIGHAGFMAVGAYTAGLVSVATKSYKLVGPEALSDQIFFVGSLLCGGLLAAAFGFVVGLPSLRLRGDYLAIVTLGFGEIIRVIIQNTPALGGALGINYIPQRATFGMIWFWAFVVVLVAKRLASSSHGRSLWAIREDEVAAEAMGVDTTAYKVRAFVVSSFFAGIAGGLFAHFVPNITPSTFDFVKSMDVVVMVVAGGLGSTTGAVVAAVFLTLLPEGMRSLFNNFSEDPSLASKVEQIRKPIYGVLLVVIMLSRPQGIFGTRELWDLFGRRRKGAAS
jgi:branched-chain amino acid transport system permease protein